MSSLHWYLHRLRAMDAAEILTRAREKLRPKSRSFSRLRFAKMAMGATVAPVPLLPSKSMAPARLREALEADAGKLLAGKWNLFGWKEVQVAATPEWRRDHSRGVDAPPVEEKVDHRALPGGADARAVWEINRWSEVVRLAMHGWLNDDIAAVHRAQDWLADWTIQNPPERGINWTSALEGGLRLINFCWFDALVLRMEDESGETARRQQSLRDAIVADHVSWVRRRLSFGSSANNHRLGELTGLLLAAKRWPVLESITGPAEELWNEIAECVLTQFAGDGGNREQALHYHLFAWEMALHASRAMEIHEGPVLDRLHHAAEFFMRMSHGTEPWDYGDSDDAQIVPLAKKRECAVGEWRAWMSGVKDVESEAMEYWLGAGTRSGTCQVPGSDTAALGKCRALETSWWIAKESGMASCQRDGWKVRVDASPLGFGRLAAHGHCDALHVSIWDGDHALVIDPGTGGYFSSPELREKLASWNSHNGPRPLEGFKTPRRVGTFLWAHHHGRPAMQCENDRILCCALEHEGQSLQRDITVEHGKITVADHHHAGLPLFVNWIFAPQCELHLQDDGIMLVRESRSWKIEFSSGRSDRPGLMPTMARVSRNFGLEQRSPALEVASHSSRLTTMITRIPA